MDKPIVKLFPNLYKDVVDATEICAVALKESGYTNDQIKDFMADALRWHQPYEFLYRVTRYVRVV